MVRKRRHYSWSYLPDGETLFRQYVLMGQARSFGKMVKWCKSQGIVHPKTGKPPTAMSIWFRCWRWALKKENQDKAYELYNSALLDDGKFMTKEEWKKELDITAQTCFQYNPRTYREYLNGTY